MVFISVGAESREFAGDEGWMVKDCTVTVGMDVSGEMEKRSCKWTRFCFHCHWHQEVSRTWKIARSPH